MINLSENLKEEKEKPELPKPKLDLKGLDLDETENDDLNGYVVEEPKAELEESAKPTNSSSTLGGLFSLQDLEKEVEAEMEETKMQNENTTQFSKEEFIEFINDFLKEKNKDLSGIEKSILKLHNFAVENNILKYELSTINLKESLLLIKADILEYLRKRCKSNKINMEITIVETEEEESEKVPYSPKEKLKKMQEEYPVLSEFINKFEFRFKM